MMEERLVGQKKFIAIANEIMNNPATRDDCWYVPATKKDGYHELKISSDGSKGRPFNIFLL